MLSLLTLASALQALKECCLDRNHLFKLPSLFLVVFDSQIPILLSGRMHHFRRLLRCRGRPWKASL